MYDSTMEPIRITCNLVSDVISPHQIVDLSKDGTHVVLQFLEISKSEIVSLISDLSNALPDYAIFQSSFSPVFVTVMPLVTKDKVLEHLPEISQAIASYYQACATLVSKYESGSLPSDWQTDEHGEHCKFENLRTGQVVEAPLFESVEPDAYFFAEFVKTTVGMEPIAKMIGDKYFHNGLRILEIVKQNT
jgi:hypothetical protein